MATEKGESALPTEPKYGSSSFWQPPDATAVSPAFRQLIRPGQRGRDVKAVKLAYKRMGTQGSGAMTTSERAGPAFVHATRAFQHNHGLHVDGVYGRATHNKLAGMRRDGKRAFSSWAAMLYRTAAIRRVGPPPAPPGTSVELAKKLLAYHREGKYRADNPGDLRDIQATAAGRAVWSQAGRWVHIDRRVFDILVWLIEAGYGPIGTYAICSDHHYDGPHGHSGGLAVDISTVKGVTVASLRSRSETLATAVALHSKRPASLAPWQLICGGYGYVPDSEILRQCIPSAAFYGSEVAQHRNHIHCGYR